LDYANSYRALAGVPPAEAEAALSANCEQHARYMIQNNSLTHTQDPDLPGASPEGANCAQQGNVWLGSGRDWQATDPIEAWLGSVGHRMWLLYPTAQTFGYGFYKSGTEAAAALDILSGANLEADPDYEGWPVRYPAPNQTRIPATDYPITLTWPYFGPSPVLDSVELISETGLELPFTANTELPAGHKGIQILPETRLAPYTGHTVTVTGSYETEPFSYTWNFSTGDTPPEAQMSSR
jgi:hypothetical protein